MHTNLYLVEKFDSAHRADLLQEAAHDRQTAGMHRGTMRLGWRVAGTIGSLFIRLGSWLERSTRRGDQMMLDV